MRWIADAFTVCPLKVWGHTIVLSCTKNKAVQHVNSQLDSLNSGHVYKIIVHTGSLIRGCNKIIKCWRNSTKCPQSVLPCTPWYGPQTPPRGWYLLME